MNFHPFDKADDSEDNYHDIVLLHLDYEEWIANTLEPELKKVGFNVFIPVIDIPLGTIYDQEMAKAFENTHRVIVVLSQKFIEDKEISMRGFYAAHSHVNPAKRKQFLVLIKMEHFDVG